MYVLLLILLLYIHSVLILMVMYVLFYSYCYVCSVLFLLLYMLCSIYSVFIVPTGTLRLPQLRFSLLFLICKANVRV